LQPRRYRQLTLAARVLELGDVTAFVRAFTLASSLNGPTACQN
jgi:hypothetical protein